MNDHDNAVDTIVAVATPEGVGGLAVVRLSGPAAVSVAGRIFRDPGFARGPESHRAVLGLAVAPDAGEALDEVVVLPMLAPRSYTGEDVVEITCHGGAVPARTIADACVEAGARPAGPGEFTRRAFLNGKLSLDRAEAVADLIHAEDRLAARAALRQLRGGMDREIAACETPLRELLAELEGGLEFADDEAMSTPAPRLRAVLDAALVELDRLCSFAAAARRVREGVQVVLAGPPNSGKSSLFNALLDRPRALVDDEAGTTRDVLRERMDHGDCVFVLHDTAGLREAAARVEARGVTLARETVAGADVVLLLRDLSDPDAAAGTAAAAEIASLAPVGCAVIEVGAKSDLAVAADGVPGFLLTSAATGEGIVALRDALLEAARAGEMREAASLGVAWNRRHRHKLAACRDDLRELRDLVGEGSESDAPAEVLASMLAATLAGLGEITGRVFTEELLDVVFDKFCVGK